MTHIKKLLLAAACSTALLGSNALSANTDNQNADLKTVATFDAQHPPGNIAITRAESFYLCMVFLAKSKKLWSF